MFCPSCGKELPENALFCAACGKKLNMTPNSVAKADAPEEQTSISAAGAKEKAVSAVVAYAGKEQSALLAPAAQSGFRESASQGFASPAGGQSSTQVPGGNSLGPTGVIPGAVGSGASGPAGEYATGVIEKPFSAPVTAKEPRSPFSAVGIVARVSSAAALVCMFLPWLRVDALNSLGQFGSMLGLNTTKDHIYTMFQLNEAFRSIRDYVSTGTLGRTFDMFFYAWIIAVLVVVASIIVSFVIKSKSSLPIIVGAAIATALAIAWLWYVTTTNGDVRSGLKVPVDVLSAPYPVLLTIGFGVLSIVLAVIDRSKSPRKSGKAN